MQTKADIHKDCDCDARSFCFVDVILLLSSYVLLTVISAAWTFIRFEVHTDCRANTVLINLLYIGEHARAHVFCMVLSFFIDFKFMNKFSFFRIFVQFIL